MKKQYSLAISMVLVLCLIAPLCALGAPQYPFAAAGGGGGAYIGPDSRLYQQSGDAPLAEGPVYALVHVDEGAAYCLTPMEGGAAYQLMRVPFDGAEATVLAQGVHGPAYFADGVFYYIDDAAPANVMAVTDAGAVINVATLPEDAAGQGTLSPGVSGMYYEVPGEEGPQAQYLLSATGGSATPVDGPLYYRYRRFDSYETAMLKGDMVARSIGDGEWKVVGPQGGDAAELDGALFYVNARNGTPMLLMKYDSSTDMFAIVGNMPSGSTGQLAAAEGWLYTSMMDGSAPVRISPVDASASPVEGASGTDGLAGTYLVSLGSDILLYQIDASDMPVWLSKVSLSAPAEEAQQTEAPADPEETEEAVETDEPEEVVEPEVPEIPGAGVTPMPEPTSTPRPEKTPGKSGYVELLRGDWGKQVTRLQNRLITLGYLAKGNADGDFGSRTQAAVKLFQKQLGLKQNGVASVSLQQKLFAKNAPKYNPAKYIALAKGDKGSYVTQLQKRLKTLGYYAGSTAGSYNARTVAAVKLFQREIGEDETGKASVALQKKMFAKDAPKLSLDILIELRTGDTGERVKKLQRRLKKLGYFDGNIGGNYLTKTTAAVKRFQGVIGEKKTGRASVALQEQLFDKNAPVNPTPLPKIKK